MSSKISELDAAASVASTDLIPIVSGTDNFKATGAQVATMVANEAPALSALTTYSGALSGDEFVAGVDGSNARKFAVGVGTDASIVTRATADARYGRTTDVAAVATYFGGGSDHTLLSLSVPAGACPVGAALDIDLFFNVVTNSGTLAPTVLDVVVGGVSTVQLGGAYSFESAVAASHTLLLNVRLIRTATDALSGYLEVVAQNSSDYGLTSVGGLPVNLCAVAAAAAASISGAFTVDVVVNFPVVNVSDHGMSIEYAHVRVGTPQ